MSRFFADQFGLLVPDGYERPPEPVHRPWPTGGFRLNLYPPSTGIVLDCGPIDLGIENPGRDRGPVGDAVAKAIADLGIDAPIEQITAYAKSLHGAMVVCG